ncbi:hypothetical protein P9990_17675 [Prescottella equi]|uniref:hypothetical protein n=1 Tax=Rhodococcus hoagii TaxID=43767 RepID=UPI002575FB9A|nr:hypothetical protein [Prescottella equi]WJJ10402.1 hypothetical protein P9990_17675 [Prescottella equi]
MREPAARGDGALPRLPAHPHTVAAVAAAAALALMAAFTLWLARRIHREAYGPPIPMKPEGEEPE